MLAYAILTALKLETGIRPFMETRHLGTIHVLPHYCYVIFDTLPLCRQTSSIGKPQKLRSLGQKFA